MRDIITMAKLLAHMRARVESPDLPPSEFTIAAETISHAEAPYDLVKTMRASILTLGPLVGAIRLRARFACPEAAPSERAPWTCTSRRSKKWARRFPIDHGYVEARCERLHGTEIHFEKITVTGTENILTAAVLAEGETVITNAAREPEVIDLIDLLKKMGAKIEGGGTSTIRVQGVDKLHGATHAVIPDRIEAGTFIVAAAITGGDVQAHALRAAASHRRDRKARSLRRRNSAGKD